MFFVIPLYFILVCRIFSLTDEKGSLRREREFIQQCMDSLKNASATFNEVWQLVHPDVSHSLCSRH